MTKNGSGSKVLNSSMSLFGDLFPFVGMLLSIAFLPVWAPRFWERFYGLVALFWSLGAFIPECLKCIHGVHGWEATALGVGLPLLSDFLPFILLLSTLYIVTGGLTIHIGFRGTPWVNTVFLGIFGLLASFVGTTGAAMLGIRPLVEMNHARTYRVHTILFFIFLVCNVGGCLSAIGDPPLFLGFLKGIPFFWPTTNLWPSFLFVGGTLLGMYFGIEWVFWQREKKSPAMGGPPRKWLVIKGKSQIFLIVAVLVSLAGTGHLDLGHVAWGSVYFSLSNGLRNGLLFCFMGLSFYLKPLAARAREHWHMRPLTEITLLFMGIFITAEPVLQLLKQGITGPLGAVLSLFLSEIPQPTPYFWLTGFFSSFLDNAPTYLIFFTMGGRDPSLFLGPLKSILVAISLGSVFMGALTYIGNAPNLLVKAIVEEEYHIQMPSFFGYMIWSSLCLLPVLFLWSRWLWE